MGKGRFGTIIQIGDILVSEDVVMEYFACDYAVCRGACCIAGDSGAPLDEAELEGLERAYPAYNGTRAGPPWTRKDSSRWTGTTTSSRP